MHSLYSLTYTRSAFALIYILQINIYIRQVATNCPYDESVDVYSLALVLWEIASLERPYKGYNKAKFFDRVVGATHMGWMDGAETGG